MSVTGSLETPGRGGGRVQPGNLASRARVSRCSGSLRGFLLSLVSLRSFSSCSMPFRSWPNVLSITGVWLEMAGADLLARREGQFTGG